MLAIAQGDQGHSTHLLLRPPLRVEELLLPDLGILLLHSAHSVRSALSVPGSARTWRVPAALPGAGALPLLSPARSSSQNPPMLSKLLGTHPTN